MTRRLLPLLLLVAVAVAGCGGHDSDQVRRDCTIDSPKVKLVYAARPTPAAPATDETIALTVRRMCERVRRTKLKGVGVRPRGAAQIEVQLAGAALPPQLGGIVQADDLVLFDWEPNVYGDKNQPLISIFEAVRVAARQKPRAEATDIPAGGVAPSLKQRFHGDQRAIERYYDAANDSGSDRYYLFGRDRQPISPGGMRVTSGAAAVNAYFSSRAQIAQASPPAGSRVLHVPRGVAVIAAEKDPSGSPALGYWPIEDDAELTGADIRDVRQEFDPQTNEPIVTFQFTDAGRRAFARATRREALRGANIIRPPGTPVDSTFQRFALVLDNQIVSLATVSYRDNPRGIDGSTGAQINGVGNIQAARDLAENLSTGGLPVQVQLVRVER